jgi:hypothetical protein
MQAAVIILARTRIGGNENNNNNNKKHADHHTASWVFLFRARSCRRPLYYGFQQLKLACDNFHNNLTNLNFKKIFGCHHSIMKSRRIALKSIVVFCTNSATRVHSSLRRV